MQRYPDQVEASERDPGDISESIKALLKDKLPDCPTNDWFIKSVHFANLMDSICRLIDKE